MTRSETAGRGLDPDGVADPACALVGERSADHGDVRAGARLGVAVPGPGDQVRRVHRPLGETEELRLGAREPTVVGQQRLCPAYARDRRDRLLRRGVERLAGVRLRPDVVVHDAEEVGRHVRHGRAERQRAEQDADGERHLERRREGAALAPAEPRRPIWRCAEEAEVPQGGVRRSAAADRRAGRAQRLGEREARCAADRRHRRQRRPDGPARRWRRRARHRHAESRRDAEEARPKNPTSTLASRMPSSAPTTAPSAPSSSAVRR